MNTQPVKPFGQAPETTAGTIPRVYHLPGSLLYEFKSMQALQENLPVQAEAGRDILTNKVLLLWVKHTGTELTLLQGRLTHVINQNANKCCAMKYDQEKKVQQQRW